MKTITFDDKAKWEAYRRGRITGTRLKDLVVKRGTGKKIGFYQLIAERIAVPADNENRMDRGLRLEDEAMQRFAKETGKKVENDLVIWEREDNADIAISPDGVIGKTEAVEVKCLASERHIQALIEQKIPSEYELQVMQYFIVNDNLRTLYFVFYDPRVTRDFFYLTFTRKELKEDIEKYIAYEKETLAEVDEWVNKLTF